MNKSKRRDELVAQAVDREIRRWDPQSTEFVDLVVRDIECVQWHPRESTVADEVVALLGGDLDVESKKKILCACDCSSGMAWNWYFNTDKPEWDTLHYAVPLEKLLNVFASRHVPYEWKRETLLKAMDRNRNYGREYGIPLIPLEYEKDSEDTPAVFRMILGFSFYRPDDEKWVMLIDQLQALEKMSSGSVSNTVDCYGNNAHIYAFCRYWATNEVNGRECNHYWRYGTCLADELTRIGCDPAHENEFGIARCNVIYGAGYEDGKVVCQ